MAAELSRRGYLASITLRNSRGVDILATNRDATKSVAIQVKTNQVGVAEWILTEKVETSTGDDSLPESLFFVFVNLPPTGEPPNYYSSRVVTLRASLKKVTRDGLLLPGAAANPTPEIIRSGSSRTPKVSTDRWDLLRLD